jgi:hypothetical protein
MNDAVNTGIRLSEVDVGDLAGVKSEILKLKGKFEFVGEVENFSAGSGRKAFLSNPHNVRVLRNETSIQSRNLRTRDSTIRQYSGWSNNCQHHAYAVLEDMGLR